MPLTNTSIKTAKTRAKPYKLFDEKGLFLSVEPTGARLWRLKYRYNRKEKKLSLGSYPETGLKEARDKRDEARRLLAAGIDPSQKKKADKVARALQSANMTIRTVHESELQKWDVLEDRFFWAKEEFSEALTGRAEDELESAAEVLRHAACDAIRFRSSFPQVRRDKEQMAGMLMKLCHGFDEYWLESLAVALIASTGNLPPCYPMFPDGDAPPVPDSIPAWEPIAAFWATVHGGAPSPEAAAQLPSIRAQTEEQLASKMLVAAYVGAERLTRGMWSVNFDLPIKLAEVYVAVCWTSAQRRSFGLLPIPAHSRMWSASFSRRACL